MQLSSKLVTLIAVASTAAVPAVAFADPPASVTLTVAATATTGMELPIGVVAGFAVGDNGSQSLTLFLVGPGASCPSQAIAPTGADIVLAAEAADKVLLVNALSAPLSRPGTWTACGYLTAQGVVTASASQSVSVSGSPIAVPPSQHGKRHRKAHAHVKHHVKHHAKHHKP